MNGRQYKQVSGAAELAEELLFKVFKPLAWVGVKTLQTGESYYYCASRPAGPGPVLPEKRRGIMMLLKSENKPEQVCFRRRSQKPLLLLQDFLRRNQNVMEISFNGYEYKDAASCRSTFAKAIRYYGLEEQIAVRATGGKVYLIRLSTQMREEE